MKLSERFTDALTFATQLHANQTRKGGGVPYISHLLGVASIALEYGANEDEAIAALLHDAIEDQGGAATREEIRHRFGDVAAPAARQAQPFETFGRPSVFVFEATAFVANRLRDENLLAVDRDRPATVIAPAVGVTGFVDHVAIFVYADLAPGFREYRG